MLLYYYLVCICLLIICRCIVFVFPVDTSLHTYDPTSCIDILCMVNEPVSEFTYLCIVLLTYKCKGTNTIKSTIKPTITINIIHIKIIISFW